MRANRRINTTPEIALRSLLHRMGYRFRKDFPIIIGSTRIRPDVAFTKRHVAVFVDGCFWHACPEHCDLPKSNLEYWLPKLERNTRKDRLQDDLLRSAGWTVLRIWEHVSPAEAAQLVISAIRSNNASR